MSNRAGQVLNSSSGSLAVRPVGLLLLIATFLANADHAALPKRLVILLDGVSYRDVKALQEGGGDTDGTGNSSTPRAFNQEYYPVSRLVSTFPSASDVAWTEILGNRPLPGYQPTYLNAATGELVRQNGVTISVEYELQMHWQLKSGIRRALGYGFPHTLFKHEVRELTKAFLEARDGPEIFYAYIRSADDAQHTVGNISKLLRALDRELQKLCDEYQAIDGRRLEILILSDHGNNHAGGGKQVRIQSFLKRSGYNVTESLRNPKDVVLPTIGIQSWVEVDCARSEAESLGTKLAQLEGVDLVTVRKPGQEDQFLVINSKGNCALIDWDRHRDAFRYEPRNGDPLDYKPVIAALEQKGWLDADGYANADSWMAETMTHHYPLALERIARAHTSITLNPAPILISLRDGYVHSNWLVKLLSSLIPMGGTHGGLDDLCSNGLLLSNFRPTQDTSARRVANLFDGFEGLKDPHAGENGADWVYQEIQVLASAARAPIGLRYATYGASKPLLKVWTPLFLSAEAPVPIEVTIKLERRFATPRIRRSDPARGNKSLHVTLLDPLTSSERPDYERIYRMPDTAEFEPTKTYRISGRAHSAKGSQKIFDFVFQTDNRGLPVVR